MKRRLILALLCALLLCGCGAKPQEMSEDEIERLKAYRFPEPPTIQTIIDSDELVASFGNVAQGVQIVERNINGWHKVQLVYDYPGGKPENWESMCEALAAGTSSYKERATAELVTPRGALLASAINGKLTYDAFEHITEPRKAYEHSEKLANYDKATYYVSSKNAFYHTDGTCGPHLSKVYYAVNVDDAVDERKNFCPVCASDISNEIKNVARTSAPGSGITYPEPPDYSVELDDLVCIPKSGRKYHSTVLCSNMDADRAQWIPLAEALERGYTRCSNCW